MLQVKSGRVNYSWHPPNRCFASLAVTLCTQRCTVHNQTETESSGGAMINRWRQDSHYQALTRVWVCCGRIALCPRQSLRQTQPIQLLSKKKKREKEPQRPKFLEPKQRFAEQEKNHSDSQVYRSAVVTPKKTHCLPLMTSIVWQQSLTQHLASS